MIINTPINNALYQIKNREYINLSIISEESGRVFYKCEKLIMYVYDKHNIIHDIDNFVRALEKNKGSAGKNIKVYVEQNRKLI